MSGTTNNPRCSDKTEGRRQPAVEPIPLRSMRELIAAHASPHTAAVDRRGFSVWHWPSPVTERKPIELSLEHEVLLAAEDFASRGRIVTALHIGEEQPSGHYILAEPAEIANWVVRRYARAPGPQSVDVFFDVDPQTLPLTNAGFTVRVRTVSGPFMTWQEPDGDHLLPVNAELPASAINSSGFAARLEFNWLAPTLPAVPGTVAGPPCPLPTVDDPLGHLQRLSGLTLDCLVPVSRHRTVRSKFSWWDLDGSGPEERHQYRLRVCPALDRRKPGGLGRRRCVIRAGDGRH